MKEPNTSRVLTSFCDPEEENCTYFENLNATDFAHGLEYIDIEHGTIDGRPIDEELLYRAGVATVDGDDRRSREKYLNSNAGRHERELLNLNELALGHTFACLVGCMAKLAQAKDKYEADNQRANGQQILYGSCGLVNYLAQAENVQRFINYRFGKGYELDEYDLDVQRAAIQHAIEIFGNPNHLTRR